MSNILNVRIVLGRCGRSRGLFGVRFEELERGRWVADWAFPLNERTAKREKFGVSDISGSFSFAAAYPGCPGCGAKGMFRCSCGKMACWDTSTKNVLCPWCGTAAMIEGEVDRLSVGDDA